MTLIGKRPPNRDPELQRTELVQDTKALMVQDTKSLMVQDTKALMVQDTNALMVQDGARHQCLDGARHQTAQPTPLQPQPIKKRSYGCRYSQ